MGHFHTKDLKTLYFYNQKHLDNLAREIYGKVRSVLIKQEDYQCEITLSDYKGEEILKFTIFSEYSNYGFNEDFEKLCLESVKKYVDAKEYKDNYDIEFNYYEDWKKGMDKYE